MKIQKLLKSKSQALYKIDEYTVPLGAIIFDGSKEGSISESYFFRFNKTIKEHQISENVSVRDQSSIDFYINEKTQQIQLIEFVGLAHFEQIIDLNLTAEVGGVFFEPVIDISTWVSSFGGHKNFSYDGEDKLYLHTEDQVNLKIIHNNKDIVQFVFGELINKINLNEQISICIDDQMNLSSFVIRDEKEIPKLIKELLK